MFKLKLNNFIKLKKKTFSIVYNKKVLVMWESSKPNDIISFFSVGGFLLTINCYHLVDVISFSLAQSYHNKWLPLYLIRVLSLG